MSEADDLRYGAHSIFARLRAGRDQRQTGASDEEAVPPSAVIGDDAQQEEEVVATSEHSTGSDEAGAEGPDGAAAVTDAEHTAGAGQPGGSGASDTTVAADDGPDEASAATFSPAPPPPPAPEPPGARQPNPLPGREDLDLTTTDTGMTDTGTADTGSADTGTTDASEPTATPANGTGAGTGGAGAEDGAELAPHPASVRHQLPRTLAIANQKGGVGKTTTAVNLGAALAELDYRVLVVDLDPQGNATTGLGINGRNLDASIYDVILHDVPIEDVIEPTTLRNLFVVPATIDLAGAEIELVPVFSRELRLRRALETIASDFDYMLIDCPPSLGLLTVNGLAAAGEVVVPIQCEYYALEGLGQLLRNVGLVQSNLNPDLELSTIILTMFDARTRLAEQVVEEVRKHFGDVVCRNVVPRTVRLSEAPSFGQPIIVFDSSSRGAIAYRELAKEVSGGAAQRIG